MPKQWFASQSAADCHYKAESSKSIKIHKDIGDRSPMQRGSFTGKRRKILYSNNTGSLDLSMVLSWWSAPTDCQVFDRWALLWLHCREKHFSPCNIWFCFSVFPGNQTKLMSNQWSPKLISPPALTSNAKNILPWNVLDHSQEDPSHVGVFIFPYLDTGIISKESPYVCMNK